MTRDRPDLRQGDYREALADVAEVDAVVTDPPYSDALQGDHNHATRASRGLASSYTRVGGGR